MRRFTLNVIQAILAIVLASCAIISFFTTVMVPVSPLPRHSVFLHFYDGRFRVFWIQSEEDPLTISLMGNGPDVRIEPYHEVPAMPASMVGVDIPRREWFRTIQVGGYRNVPAFGGAWRTPMAARAFGVYTPAYSTFVRMPAWLPCLLLLYSPVRAIIRGVRQRYRNRNNLCMTCGYHLHALTLPRCPECGTAIQQAAG